MALIASALFALTACGGATATGTPTSAPATPTAAPSVAGPSPSLGVLPSGLVIPSFAFPNEDSELEEDSVIRNFQITAADGKTYDTKHYNLSAIIAVGYKVNSERAVQFRKWATRVVEEFTIKGFAMEASIPGPMRPTARSRSSTSSWPRIT